MKPRLHLWIRKEAMEAIRNFTKYLSYIIIFKLTLGCPWATHKSSSRVAQDKTIEYNRQPIAHGKFCRYLSFLRWATNKSSPGLHKYMTPRLHLWIQKEAMEALRNFAKYFSYLLY